MKFIKERFYTLLDEIFAAIIISVLGVVIYHLREKVVNFFNDVFTNIKGLGFLITGLLFLIFILGSFFIWRKKLKLVPKNLRRDWDIPVKDRYGKKNPFIVGTPVFGRNFYGREREIKFIYERLSARESCSVISNRRVGKTSLLLHLSHAPTIKTVGKDCGIDPRKTVFIYFPTSAFENEPQFWQGLYDKLASESLLQITLNSSKQIDFQDFSNLLRDVNNKGISVILLFDEFDMTITQMSRTFFERMRSFPGQFNVCYVVVTIKSLRDYVKLNKNKTISSPFPNIFQQVELGLMPNSEARGMMFSIFKNGGFTFEQRDIEFLIDLAGPHPFFLQKAGYTFVNVYISPPKSTLQLKSKTKIFEKIEKEFYDSALPFYEEYFEKLDSQEQLALVKLAQNNSTNIDKKIIETLKQRVLVRKENGKWIPFSKSFKTYLLTTQLSKTIPN